MLVPYFLILSSKEKPNYTKIKFISFLTGISIIIFSEGIIRFVSEELIRNIHILILPFAIFFFLYLTFIYKLNSKTK